MIRQFENLDELSRAAAEEFVRLAREAIATRGRSRVVLSGGSTPRRLYEFLAEQQFLEWSKVEFFWGDERAVPPDHKDSNYHMAREAMLDRLAVPEANVHRIEAERDTAARDYEAVIARAFGVEPGGVPPAFDLVLLGMGADGHTASLFPHWEALKETSRWVVKNVSGRRITLTPRILNRAAHVIFLVAGAEKAGVLAEVLEGPSDPERLPAQLIRPATWFVDHASAAKLLKRSPA